MGEKLRRKMKTLLILILFWGGITENTAEDVRCTNEGCYEVVKVFAELLEKKITETDAVSNKTILINQNSISKIIKEHFCFRF